MSPPEVDQFDAGECIASTVTAMSCMAVVDDVLAKEGDKPTIGLLLCRNKKEVVAEYALRNFKAPIGVAEWTTAINSSLPEEFESALPSVAELEAELALATEED